MLLCLTGWRFREGTFLNDSGIVQGYTFDTIIIPGNVPELEDLIKRIIRSDLIVGSNNNDVNTQKGLWISDCSSAVDGSRGQGSVYPDV